MPRFGKAFLAGRNVLVTRSEQEAKTFLSGLRARGARAWGAPAIAIRAPRRKEALDREISRLSEFDWLLFTSAHGVEKFFSRWRRFQPRPLRPSGLKVAAVGRATAKALRRFSFRVDLVPKIPNARGLLAKMREVQNQRILIARAEKAPGFLPETLARRGASVQVAPAYRTIFLKSSWKRFERRLTRGRIDCVAFTSSSTVESLVAHAGKRGAKKLLLNFRPVAIGPPTAETLRQFGARGVVTAKSPGPDGLIRAVEGALR